MQIVFVLLVLSESEIDEDNLVVFGRQVLVAPEDIVRFEVSVHYPLLSQDLQGAQQRPKYINLVLLLARLFRLNVLLEH